MKKDLKKSDAERRKSPATVHTAAGSQSPDISVKRKVTVKPGGARQNSGTPPVRRAARQSMIDPAGDTSDTSKS